MTLTFELDGLALLYILLATGVGALVFLFAGGTVADDGEDGHGNG